MRTTLNLDDALVVRAKLLAVQRGTTLTALIEEGLTKVVETAPGPRPRLQIPAFGEPGGGPTDFPWHSGSLMIEYLEGPDAST